MQTSSFRLHRLHRHFGGAALAAFAAIVGASLAAAATPAPLAGSIEYRCGERTLTFGDDAGKPAIEVGGERYDLHQEPSASGARYVGAGDAEFWSHGDEATLKLADGKTETCHKVAEKAAARDDDTLAAIGHEPGWRLTIGKDGLALTSLDPKLEFKAADVRRESVDGHPHFAAEAGGRKVAVTVTEHPCADIATGMPFPVGVRIDVDGRQLEGCGGRTMDLLAGGWRVIHMEGGAIPDGVVVTMEFNSEGHVFGSGGCNRFNGPYRLTGEGLTIGPLGATMMACPDPQSETERRFFKLIDTVTRVTTGENGQLRLMAGDAPAMVIDRAL